MNQNERSELIKRLTEEVRTEYIESLDDNDFELCLNSEYPLLLSKVQETAEKLKLQIRTLVKAYEIIDRLPMFPLNSDFESLDIIINDVYKEALMLLDEGLEINKNYIVGADEVMTSL